MFVENPYFALDRDEHDTFFVRSHDEVITIPIDDDGHVLLAIEPSPAFGQKVWVFPGGMVEPGETHDVTAYRELREELGFAAGRLDYLGELWPWSKYLATRSIVYLARNLFTSPLDGDEAYEIRVERVPLSDIDTFVATGQIRDARVIAGLSLARAFLQQHE